MDWGEFWRGLGNGLFKAAMRGGLIMLALNLVSGGGGLILAMGAMAVMEFVGNVQGIKKHERKLLNQFRHEIAAGVGKDPEAVTVADLKRQAERNPVLQQSLQEDGARMLTGWMSFALAFAATGLLGGTIPIFPGAENGSVAFFEWARDVSFTQSLGVSIGGTLLVGGVLNAARALFKPLVHGLVGGDRQTIAERVGELEAQLYQGKALAPEQVMEVAVAANPKLRRNLREAWSKDYLSMSANEQCVVLSHYPAQRQVETLAGAINRGHVRPTEMAYAVLGRSSGVAWDHYPSGPKAREPKQDFGEWVEELPEILTEGPSVGGMAAVARRASDTRYQPAHYSRQAQPAKPTRSFVEALEKERAAAQQATMAR